jgi:hypothetical protein
MVEMNVEHEGYKQRLGLAALYSGVLAALVAALFQGHVSRNSREFSSNVLAYVADEPVLRSDYEFLLATIAEDRRSPVSAADRHLALSRLLQDELLLQEALRRDLLRQDDALRKEATITMLEMGAGSGFSTSNSIEESRESALDAYLKRLRDFAVIRWVRKQ